MDDDKLSREEIKLLFEATKRRIEYIEQKAFTRLAMNDEEKALYKAWRAVQKDPELRDLVINFLIASSGESKQG